MKRRVPFVSDCGVGFILIMAILFVVAVSRVQDGTEGSYNILPFVAPIVFIPLLVSVLHSKSPSCYQKLYNKGKGYYSKHLCVWVVGGLLALVTLVSAVILYYGW